ncbi:MAG: hypothetical protein JWR12_2974 [Mucilaginibacter sp.]|nr:hypothetical protein [Mucilaginibacter sp.]
MKDQDILNLPITQLGLSAEFCEQSKKMGYQRLDEVFRASATEIQANKAFTYTWLGELSAFLHENKMLHLLQPAPGKNFD